MLLGIGAIIGAGIFVLTGTGRGELRGPGHRALVRPRGYRLRLRRPLLRRVRGDDPGRRVGVHLRLRDPGRARRLDHRLGPDPRVPLRRLHRRGRLVRLLGLLPEGPRHQHPAASTPPRRTPTWPRRDAGWNVWRLFTEGWTATGAVLNLPAMFIVAGDHHPARRRHQRVGHVQQHRRCSSRSRWCCSSSPSAWPTSTRPTGTRSFRPHGGRGQVRLGRRRSRGAAVIFFAYIGFDAVSTAAQEAKNPQRDMPIGILGSLAICTVLYIVGGAGAHRHRQVHRAQRARPDRGRHQRRRSRPGLAPAGRQDRRDRGPRVGHAGDAPGPAAHLLHDGARTACCRRCSARCIRGSARPGSPRGHRRLRDGVRRAPARSACWASWSRSGRCSRS